MIRTIKKGTIFSNNLEIDRLNSIGSVTICTGWGLYLKRFNKTDAMDRVAEYDIYRLMKGIKNHGEQHKIVARLGDSISDNQAFTLLMSGKITSYEAEKSLLQKLDHSQYALELLASRKIDTHHYLLEGKEFPAFSNLAESIDIKKLEELVDLKSPNKETIRFLLLNAIKKIEAEDAERAVKIGAYSKDPCGGSVLIENEIVKPVVGVLLSRSRNNEAEVKTCDSRMGSILLILRDFPSNVALNAITMYVRDIDSSEGAERMLHMLAAYAGRCPKSQKSYDEVQVFLAERISEIAKKAKSKDLLEFTLEASYARLIPNLCSTAYDKLDTTRQYLRERTQTVLDAHKD